MRFMTDSLSQSINKISQIDKEIHQTDENKFKDNMRSTMASLSQLKRYQRLTEKYHKLIKKETDNKFIDNVRSMMTSLSLSIDKISEINNKISQIDKKEKKITDNMRFMINSL